MDHLSLGAQQAHRGSGQEEAQGCGCQPDKDAHDHSLAKGSIGHVDLPRARKAGNHGRRTGGNGAKEHSGHKDPLVGQANRGEGGGAQVSDQVSVDDADHHAQKLLSHGRQGQAQHVAANAALGRCLVGQVAGFAQRDLL